MIRLLLVGGGHAHVEVLRRLARRPVPGLEATLVSPNPDTPYSGMLPGLIAGHYGWRDCHIALPPLCSAAGANFLRGRVTGLDPGGRTASCSDGSSLVFDLLSIDIGSTPNRSVPGSDEHAIAIKPIDRFLAAFDELRARCAAGSVRRIAVVGGGAGGVEVTLAMQYRLHRELPATVPQAEFHLLGNTPTLLPDHAPAVRHELLRILERRGVRVHLTRQVTAVEPGAICCVDGIRREVDAVVWVVTASAAPWLRASGLACDERGFIAVDDRLRSISHPFVFGGGDCVTELAWPVPKSGAYAIQQGPVLAENLRRIARALLAAGSAPAVESGEPRLLTYHPRPRALALITTGHRHAVASRGWLHASGRWVWRWKDWIDRRFMARYRLRAEPGAPASRREAGP